VQMRLFWAVWCSRFIRELQT